MWDATLSCGAELGRAGRKLVLRLSAAGGRQLRFSWKRVKSGREKERLSSDKLGQKRRDRSPRLS